MFLRILAVLAIILAVFAGAVALQPSEFYIERTEVMAVPASAVFENVNDLHKWEAWSPWVKLDPAAKNSYEGPASGPGAVMRWDGNDKVGAGIMTITDSKPDEFVRFKLEFLRPFKAVNTAEFTFKPEGNQTAVTWSMSGTNNFIGKAISLIMNCDKMVGSEFEKGLKALAAVSKQ